MPLLGFIRHRDRNAIHDFFHSQAESRMGVFSLPPPSVPKGTKLILSQLWKDQLVKADVGFEFPRFHQLTGSCVGASLGNAITTLLCVQRKLAIGPTKVILPFWPFDYGRTRYNEGDRGQGEGALNSSACDTMKHEGVLPFNVQGLPQFQNNDGLVLTSQLEMQWSDGGSSTVLQYANAAKAYPLGTAAPARSAADAKAGILNGYPFYFGCDDYVGGGQITGGTEPYVKGKFDGQGGHSTCLLGYWEHPNDGPLYLYQNNWVWMVMLTSCRLRHGFLRSQRYSIGPRCRVNPIESFIALMALVIAAGLFTVAITMVIVALCSGPYQLSPDHQRPKDPWHTEDGEPFDAREHFATMNPRQIPLVRAFDSEGKIKGEYGDTEHRPIAEDDPRWN